MAAERLSIDSQALRLHGVGLSACNKGKKMPRKKMPIADLMQSGTTAKKPIRVAISALGMSLLDEVPPAPSFCKHSKLAARFWDEVVPELVETHRLAREDQVILEEIARGIFAA